MIAYAYATPGEKTLSGALTLLMHVLLLVMLVVGVSWQKRQTQPMVAELWSSLPPPPAPKVEEPPPPKIEPKPEPPKPVPKVEPKPKPAPKPDISLREKKEKALKEKKELAEKKKKEEQARLEKLKQEAEAKRQREQEEAAKKLAQQQAAAQARLVDEYKRRIAEQIKRRIIDLPNLPGNPVAELDIIILPGGEVLDVRLRKGSGQAVWDTACERAIRQAQPLPVPPPDSPLFREFRELRHTCRYKE
jgi:colicin import membrane protein